MNSPVEGRLLYYLEVLLISVGIQIFCVFYGRLIFRKEPEGKNKCLRYGTICSNAGFLGNPVAEGIYGAEGLVLASIYLIPQRIMMWTSGLVSFSGTTDRKETVRKVLTHPCIIMSELGILLMFTGWKLPAPVTDAVDYIGNCNTAFSMMAVGMILADINVKDFWDRTVAKFTFHRLVVIPAVVYGVCSFLPLDKNALASVYCWLPCRQALPQVFWQRNMGWILPLQQKWLFFYFVIASHNLSVEYGIVTGKLWTGD